MKAFKSNSLHICTDKRAWEQQFIAYVLHKHIPGCSAVCIFLLSASKMGTSHQSSYSHFSSEKVFNITAKWSHVPHTFFLTQGTLLIQPTTCTAIWEVLLFVLLIAFLSEHVAYVKYGSLKSLTFTASNCCSELVFIKETDFNFHMLTI